MNPDLTIIHFNDVYSIKEKKEEPVGGIGRFATMLNSYNDHDNERPLVVFSGDFMSPSLMSSVTKGTHIVPMLNKLNIDVGCIGNHEFDFGIEHLEHELSKSNVKWLLSNVVLDDDSQLIKTTKKTHFMEKKGLNIGFVGLVEEDWLCTLTCLPENIKYISQKEQGIKLIQQLREEHDIDIIIAVTHNREHNDLILAEELKDYVDIILGGHDHEYYTHEVNGIPILNSGSNYRDATLVKCFKNNEEDGNKWKFELERIAVTSDFEPDEEIQAIVDEAFKELDKELDKIVIKTSKEIDCLNKTVRSSESEIGNLISDIMRFTYQADIAFCNGGVIRSNSVYGKNGVLTKRDIQNIFPFIDPTVVIQIKGKHILEALENSVAAYPALEGRFPQLSGVRLVFDSSKEPGSRLLSAKIKRRHHEAREKVLNSNILRFSTSNFNELLEKPSNNVDDWEEIDHETEYIVATKPYLLSGGDGCESFKNYTKMIVDDENGLTSSNLLNKYFVKLQTLHNLAYSRRVQNIAKAFIHKSHEYDDSQEYNILNLQLEGRIIDVAIANNNNNN
eukprot:TRINITY_DN1814_c0_g1_i1.p1 TRINITY_DN1814_c0_g1~~TRINITY_DN1814_c0_g1_i1.p1  ORF type:complete len:561 (+),score=183.64 TRINITY_DN1814_c0_g1_i1:34-1716(+)